MEKPKFNINLDDYEKGKSIGQGAFGEVFLLTNKKTGEVCAGKMSMNLMQKGSSEARDLTREINIIYKISHPSIIKFIGYSPINFQKEQRPVILTEYLPNKSLDKLNELSLSGLAPDEWDDTHKLITLYGIASGMAFLHMHDIIHRDLKPANILMDSYLHPKICDFGLSKDENNATQSTAAYKGTPLYSAPEIIDDFIYSKAGDVYAFAMIAYELFTNERPWANEKNQFKLQSKVMAGERPEFNSPIDDSYRQLIENCWEQDMNNRPTFEEIVEVLKTNSNFITELVNEDEYLQYIDFIDNQRVSYNPGPPIALFDSENPKKINEREDEYLLDFPKEIYDKLKKQSKNLVKKSIKEDNADAQFQIGKFFLMGLYSFPKNQKLGLEFLQKAVNKGYMKAVKYYCKILIEGKNIGVDLEQAKKILDSFPDTTDAYMIFLYGLFYIKKDDIDQARIYLLKASELGLNEASFELGMTYYREKDFNQAREFLIKASKKIAEANFELGMIYYKEKDDKKAKKYFDLAKKNGCSKKPPKINIINNDNLKPPEMHEKALNLINGIGCKKNISNAIFLLKSAANQEYLPSIKELAKIYYKGHEPEISINYKKAFSYYKIAASKEDITSIKRCGYMLYNGLGTNEDHKEAAKYYKIAADKGDAKAILNYVQLLKSGDGVELDLRKAIKYLNKIVNSNDKECSSQAKILIKEIQHQNDDDDDDDETKSLTPIELNERGLQYQHGYNGVNKDLQKARLFFKKSADRGEPKGMMNYANMVQGLGGPENKKEATKYYKMAADANNSNGMFIYGLMLEHGTGTKQNYTEAVKYYKKSADTGHMKAMFNYARMVQNGIGHRQDYNEALRYYQMALDAGDERAKVSISVVEKLISNTPNANDDDDDDDGIRPNTEGRKPRRGRGGKNRRSRGQ